MFKPKIALSQCLAASVVLDWRSEGRTFGEVVQYVGGIDCVITLGRSGGSTGPWSMGHRYDSPVPRIKLPRLV